MRCQLGLRRGVWAVRAVRAGVCMCGWHFGQCTHMHGVCARGGSVYMHVCKAQPCARGLTGFAGQMGRCWRPLPLPLVSGTCGRGR